MRRLALLVPIVSGLLIALACVPHQRQLRSSALDFLYPQGRDAAPASDVRLQLPVRVGLAFAPSRSPGFDTFTEGQKQDLLDRVADAFRDRDGIASVEPIPSSFLEANGGFENLDRVAAALGMDLAVLVSYDQFQFSDSGRSSWAYWTIIGAYVVKGEKNETRTMLDAVVYDIPSRALLFNASGRSSTRGRATPIDAARELRDRSEEGFSLATDDLIVNLGSALDEFETQARSGTVRGAGTPAIAMVDAEGRVVSAEDGDGGAGALGPFAAIGLAALALAGLAGHRRRILVTAWPRDSARQPTRFPWVTIGAVSVSIVATALPDVAAALEYDRERVTAGGLGRLVGASLTHWTGRMAFWDLLVVAVAGALIERRSRLMVTVTLVLGAGATALAVQFADPAVAVYRGSSGVATALFVAAAIDLLVGPSTSIGRVAAVAALTLLGLKLAVETAGGLALAAGPLPAGVRVVPAVHYGGALAGCATGSIVAAVRRTRGG